jgi:REP element-mobilizing transposase RayT
MQCLMEAHKRFGIEVHSYCLMGNHFLFLIKTPRANLSRVIRHINGLYTQRYNQLRKADGSLFRGRYETIVIDKKGLRHPVGNSIDYQRSSHFLSGFGEKHYTYQTGER